MKPAAATGLFYLFAIVNGLALSLIFVAYSLPSIFKTFLITAGTFGAMSIYGYFTEKDLTKIGSFLYMALWGLVICILVNMFWANFNPRLDHFNCRSDYLYWSDSLGHSEDQNHGSSFKRIQPIVSCNDRCADPIS